MIEKCFLIGIGGGTGSGKSSLAQELQRQLDDQGGAALLSMDDYYLDQSSVSLEDRVATNYDHPDSLDVELLTHQLSLLLSGQPIKKPVYDFATHTRTSEQVILEPVKWIIIEGILTLHYPELLELFAVTIFVDAAADVRLIRRVSRDMVERGRSIDSIQQQYLSTVRPMHQQFVEPSKSTAELVVSGEANFTQNVHTALKYLEEKLDYVLEPKTVSVGFTE